MKEREWNEYDLSEQEEQDLVSEDIAVEVFKLREGVPTPVYGTSLSSCFDISFYPDLNAPILGYDSSNFPFTRHLEYGVNPEHHSFGSSLGLMIFPGDRILIPTGLIMKIRPINSIFARSLSVRLHARSGLALKRGLVLANGEGVIDIDYQKEIFVIMTNIANIPAFLTRSERICQGEVCVNVPARFVDVVENPTQYSERNGGFGSTGV